MIRFRIFSLIELRIIRALWQAGECTPSRAAARCPAPGPSITPSRAFTILEQLTAEGFVARHDKPLRYHALISEDDYTNHVLATRTRSRIIPVISLSDPLPGTPRSLYQYIDEEPGDE